VRTKPRDGTPGRSSPRLNLFTIGPFNELYSGLRRISPVGASTRESVDDAGLVCISGRREVFGIILRKSTSTNFRPSCEQIENCIRQRVTSVCILELYYDDVVKVAID